MLKKRIISGLLMFPLPLAAVYLGNPWFAVLGAFMAVVMAWEWQSMIENKCDTYALFLAGISTTANMLVVDHSLEALLLILISFSLFGIFYNKENKKLKTLGIVYISIPLLSLIWLRETHDFLLVLWILGIVLATDIGGYIFGCSIRGPLLLPSISPKKTWAGLIGGMLMASLIGFLYARIVGECVVTFTLLSAVLAVLSQVGDFFESGIKRRLGIKDSSNLIPGHGGFFDRVDGLLFVAPVVAVFYLVQGFINA